MVEVYKLVSASDLDFDPIRFNKPREGGKGSPFFLLFWEAEIEF